jgi:hypothetical protein
MYMENLWLLNLHLNQKTEKQSRKIYVVVSPLVSTDEDTGGI